MTKIIDPWGSELPEDYVKIIKDFGLETFDKELFPDPNRLMRRGVVFAGRDLKIISKAIKEKKPFYALSGLMPTNDQIHLGNKSVVENLKYFQEKGAKTYILVADLEAAAARGITVEEGRRRALNFHIPAYIALGLDPKKTVFYFQSQNMDVVRLGYEFAQKITLNEFKGIYGSADPGRIMSAVTQVGDILFPQLAQRMPGIIPVGIDQDPHMRLTRDVVARTKQQKFFAPSSLYHKYMPSLDGGLKMSKSKADHAISLPEDIASVKKKINRALTGGRDTVEEHRRLGAEVEKDMVFELLKQHLIEDDVELQKIYDDYKSGKMLSGELKQLACKKMETFMNDFNNKLEKARKDIDKINILKFV
ncbi:tryptophan--tRNA ligase [Candidatus Woesearchaeota archaeon CG10_big_fil_rev_8_21_14_0_10_32_9]|nr:MAG: tryptophan--tRNA ligase [Candidatus Woesearchaeota archaeon CG10_big_fil_rev_8_21_14_0_10_32_9]